MKKNLFALISSLAIGIGTAHAIPAATVTLTDFIQDGTIVNDAGSGASISSIIYSLGTAGNGIATWDDNSGTTLAGGVKSGLLSSPEWFQTVTWSGLSIAPGGSFNIFSLDIDYIATLSPLSIDQQFLDTTGSSLVNGYLKVIWSNGDTGQTSLTQQAWATTQNLTINAAAGVPDTGSSLAFLGLALTALGFFGRASYARKSELVAE